MRGGRRHMLAIAKPLSRASVSTTVTAPVSSTSTHLPSTPGSEAATIPCLGDRATNVLGIGYRDSDTESEDGEIGGGPSDSSNGGIKPSDQADDQGVDAEFEAFLTQIKSVEAVTSTIAVPAPPPPPPEASPPPQPPPPPEMPPRIIVVRDLVASFSAPFSLPPAPALPTQNHPMHARFTSLRARLVQLPEYIPSDGDFALIIPGLRHRAIEAELRQDDFKNGIIGVDKAEAFLVAWERRLERVEEELGRDLTVPDSGAQETWRIIWHLGTECYCFEEVTTGRTSFQWPPEAIPQPSTIPAPNSSTEVSGTIDSNLSTPFPSFSSFNENLLPVEDASSAGESKGMKRKADELFVEPSNSKVAAPVAIRPEVLSLPKKSKKLESLLNKWKAVSEELAEDSSEEDEEYRKEKQLYNWARVQASEDTENPNFAPVAKKNV